MSWSYDESLPTSTDKVRFLIQDTDSENELVQNEEIEFALETAASDVFSAAAICCRALAAKFNKKAGLRDPQTGVIYDVEKKAQFYLGMAEEFDTKANKSFVPMPFAGGISVSDKQTRESDSDAVEPSFTRNLHSINLDSNANRSDI